MAYVKTVWATGDVITATKLNNAENGIEATAIVADAALPKAGGTMSGDIEIDKTTDGSVVVKVSGVEVGRFRVSNLGTLVVSGTGGAVIRPNGNTDTTNQLNIPATGSMTHAGATVWTAGNDGAGSGLDADKIQGTQMRFTSGYAEWNDAGTWKAVGGVKSIQRGVTTTSTTVDVDVTITAVDLNKSNIELSSFTISINSTATFRVASAYLLNSTTIRFLATSTTAVSVRWEVIEHN